MTEGAAAPSVLVVLPAALLALFPGATAEVTLCAASVDAALAVLNLRWPGMRARLCDSRPAIRRHINVFVNGERATLATPLPPGAELVVTTAISGG